MEEGGSIPFFQGLLVPRTVAQLCPALAVGLGVASTSLCVPPSEATHVSHFPVGLAGPEVEGSLP